MTTPETMTADDATRAQMYAEDGLHGLSNREYARRVMATYHECERLRAEHAALTAQLAEAKRLDLSDDELSILRTGLALLGLHHRDKVAEYDEAIVRYERFAPRARDIRVHHQAMEKEASVLCGKLGGRDWFNADAAIQEEKHHA